MFPSRFQSHIKVLNRRTSLSEAPCQALIYRVAYREVMQNCGPVVTQ